MMMIKRMMDDDDVVVHTESTIPQLQIQLSCITEYRAQC